MLFRNKKTVSEPAPEKVGYTKYYEYDGQLRAYANRSMLMAGLFGVIAFISLLFAIYVRLQPPTVIRVGADGEATVVGARRVEIDQRAVGAGGGAGVVRSFERFAERDDREDVGRLSVAPGVRLVECGGIVWQCRWRCIAISGPSRLTSAPRTTG